jgi:hypothetical protein
MYLGVLLLLGSNLLSFVITFVVTRTFFYVYRSGGVIAGIKSIFMPCMLALSINLFYLSFIFPAIMVSIIPIFIVAYHWKDIHSIKLYTDGFTVGKMEFHYGLIQDVQYATGKPIESRIPETGGGTEMIILTPIDFEFIGDDYGIFHHYLMVVMETKVYVIQPLRNKDAFAANVRNAYACYQYDLKQVATGNDSRRSGKEEQD